MKARTGIGGSFRINDDYHCDYSLYDNRLTVDLYLSVWNRRKYLAIISREKRFFRWELIFSDDIARKLTKRTFDKQLSSLNAELKRNGVSWESLPEILSEEITKCKRKVENK